MPCPYALTFDKRGVTQFMYTPTKIGLAKVILWNLNNSCNSKSRFNKFLRKWMIWIWTKLSIFTCGFIYRQIGNKHISYFKPNYKTLKNVYTRRLATLLHMSTSKFSKVNSKNVLNSFLAISSCKVGVYCVFNSEISYQSWCREKKISLGQGGGGAKMSDIITEYK